MPEPLEPVVVERLVDGLLEPPARLRVDHRQHQPIAAAAEVEAALGLEHHRQVLRQLRQLARFEQLSAERAHGKIDPARRAKLGRPRAAGDHEQFRVQGLGRGSLPDLDAEPERPADELARDRWRIGHAVGRAEDGAEHVVGAQAVHETGVEALDRDAELGLKLAPLLQLRQAVLGGGQEQVADLVEQRLAELLEEADAGLREPHLGSGRELLPDAAHRLRGGASGHLAAIGEHDLARAERSEVIRNRGADRPRSRYDDSSHSSSSRFSSSRRRRSGRRTSSRTGTPRRPRTNFAAAWNG